MKMPLVSFSKVSLKSQRAICNRLFQYQMHQLVIVLDINTCSNQIHRFFKICVLQTVYINDIELVDIPARPFSKASPAAWSMAGPFDEIIKTSHIRNCVWNGRE